ncbi:hypothetical protein [Ulvibacterium sp.]|nr:hypothetical protein [Ulvibacterium sp.]
MKPNCITIVIPVFLFSCSDVSKKNLERAESKQYKKGIHTRTIGE